MNMKWFVYVLKSAKDEGRYVGMSHDVEKRLIEHNAGYVQSTQARRPFVLVHREEYADRAQARAREKYLKSGIGREWMNDLGL